MKKIVKTVIGGYRGFHSITLQYLGNTSRIDESERLVLDLYNNKNAYQEDITDKNAFNAWFVHDWWENDEVVRQIGDENSGSLIGGWVAPQHRLIYNNLMNKHLIVQPHILHKIDNFVNEYFKNKKVLGLHIRGTDIFYDNTRPKLSFEYYKHKINLYLERGNFEKIFVCSDQTHTIDKLKKIYGDMLITYPSLTYPREGHQKTMHTPSNIKNEKYIRGEDILIESILLSQTDFLLRTFSNVTAFSILYNTTLKYCEIDAPFFDVKNYINGLPSFFCACKYETDFEIFKKQVKDFEDVYPTISAGERADFIKEYL
jgi:hypothetical protein